MVANGDGARQVWATEYGLPTSSVSEAQQAAFIHDFVASWQNVDGAGPMFIYTTRDTNTGSFDDEANFGLFETDWTKKAAADTVANLITDLADGTAEPFDVTPIPPDPAVPASGRHLRPTDHQSAARRSGNTFFKRSTALLSVSSLVTDIVKSIVKMVTGTAAAADPPLKEFRGSHFGAKHQSVAGVVSPFAIRPPTARSAPESREDLRKGAPPSRAAQRSRRGMRSSERRIENREHQRGNPRGMHQR